MMTNTDNNVLPAGMGAVNRSVVPAVGATTGNEVRGAGASAKGEAAAVTSVKQSGIASDAKPVVQGSTSVDSTENLKDVADALNKTFGEKQSLQFSVDQDTGVSVIKVTQAGTGEVVRQIPNEEALLIMQKVNQQQDSGNDSAVLFDQMA